MLTNLSLPAGLTKLTSLRVGFNQLSSLGWPTDMTNLTEFGATFNQLTKLTVPPNLANLRTLRINDNQLTNLALSAGLNKLTHLIISRNPLRSLTLPAGLTSLEFLELNSLQLTNLTLPPDVQKLTGLFVADNQLTTLVLSEPLAATGMAGVVDFIRNQGINVFTYPLAARLVRLLASAGAFKFGLVGPPGVYTVVGSTNLVTWSAVGVATNPLGSVNFTDVTANASRQKFYRVLLQTPTADMVIVTEPQ
jgi:hypothetical protein